MNKSKFQNRGEWRKFGTGLSMIVLVIAALQFILGGELGFHFLALSMVLLLVAGAIPVLLKPVYIFFMYVSEIMGWVMTRVILTILFYIILTPVGFVARIFRKNFLILKPDKSEKTYWNDVPRDRTERITYERQF